MPSMRPRERWRFTANSADNLRARTQASSNSTPSGQEKLFFGNVKWTGNGTYKIPPIKVGQDLLWVHVPGYTYKEPTPQAPNPNIGPVLPFQPVRVFGHAMDAPLPIMVDKDGRFGLVVPSGVSYVFVKMYGTLWKKVSFTTGGSQSHNFQTWYGASVDFTKTLDLRYGDVNEDNLISVDSNTPATYDRGYLNERVGGEVVMADEPGDQKIFKYDYVCDLNRDNKVDGVLGDLGFFLASLEPTQNLDGAQMP